MAVTVSQPPGLSNAGGTVTGTVTIAPSGNTSPLVLTGGTITAAAPIISATQTWNNGAVVFTGLLLNVTNTASSSSSLLVDIQLAGVTQFNVSRGGNLTNTGNITLGSANTLAFGTRDKITSTSDGVLNVFATNGTTFSTLNAGVITSASTTAIPANGALTLGFKATSTANFGVYFGSGAPNISAAKGSLYLRSDGTTVNDRAYIATDSSGTWTFLTTGL